MSKGKVAGALVCSFIVATTAASWALLGAAPPSGEFAPQTSNRDAKGDRLPAAARVTYVTAPAAPAATYGFAATRATAIEPPRPVPVPPERPKRAEPPQQLLLDDNQIASLKTRLRLTPAQEEYWPAVEVSLREVVRQHARKTAKVRPGGAVPPLDANSAEVQRLVSVAVPLIMRLSEEQKREVRTLARIIGLDTVASRI